MDGFTPVPCHTGFLAKRVFGAAAERVLDVSIAHLEPRGGGPVTPPCPPAPKHPVKGAPGGKDARTPEGVRRFGPNEALLVPGGQTHQVWNAGDGPAVVVGVTLAVE